MGDSEAGHSSGGADDPRFEVPEPEMKGNTGDGMLAAIILGAAVALVILGALLFRSKSKNGDDGGDLMWLAESSDLSTEQFEAPKERQEYIEARAKLDVKKPEDLLKLKKMLMLRSLKTIPLLYELQNGGPSVDRLYKKGLLKDEMHNRFKELKAFIDAEFVEVQKEADTLAEGWGQIVWPQANQYYGIQKQKNGEAEEPEDDEGESIIKSLSASAGPSKKKAGPSAKTATTAATGGAGKKKQSPGDEDVTRNMTEAEKAEYHAKQLEAEESRSTKKNGKRKK
jgi:LPXTG-motif cell wall-anchored protein